MCGIHGRACGTRASLGTLAGGRADDDLFRRVRDVSTQEREHTHGSGDDLMKVIWGAQGTHVIIISNT